MFLSTRLNLKEFVRQSLAQVIYIKHVAAELRLLLPPLFLKNLLSQTKPQQEQVLGEMCPQICSYFYSRSQVVTQSRAVNVTLKMDSELFSDDLISSKSRDLK